MVWHWDHRRVDRPLAPEIASYTLLRRAMRLVNTTAVREYIGPCSGPPHSVPPNPIAWFDGHVRGCDRGMNLQYADAMHRVRTKQGDRNT